MDPAQPVELGPAGGGATPADSTVPADNTVPAGGATVPADGGRGPGGRTAVPVRSDRSPKDMAVSLLVLLIPIVLVVAFYRVFLGADEPVVVDAGPAIAEARSANAFPVSEPVGLGSGWRTVSASFRRTDGGATLRIGYVSPTSGALQVVESDVPADQLLPTELAGGGQPQGVTEVAGRSWQRYPARAGERALVVLERDRTVIVIGSAREEELYDLAGALR